MQRTKQYLKGKHFYIKAGKKKEVHYLKNHKNQPVDYDKNLVEIYTDNINIEPSKNEIILKFGKSIFGTNIIKIKRIIKLDIKTAKKLEKLLKEQLDENNLSG